MKSVLTIDRLALQLSSTLDKNAPFINKHIVDTYPYVGNTYAVNTRIKLRRIDTPQTFYNHLFAIWIDNKNIGTLWTDCRQKGQEESVKLTFENEVFYTQPGWAYYLEIIEKQMPLSSKSVSSLELAHDFQASSPLLPQLSHVYRHSTFIAHNPSAEYGPLRGKLTCTCVNGKLYRFGQSVNKRGGTGKQVEAYNKSQEIRENSGKEYITAYYFANGFNVSQDVERVELKVTAEYLSQFLIYPQELKNRETLGNIFRVGVGDTFTFRKLNEYTFDDNRNKKVATATLLEFPDYSPAPLYPRPVYASETGSDNRKRSEAKSVLWRFIESGNPQDLAHLTHLASATKPPKDATWQFLFRAYASEFPGTPTAGVARRIEQFK